MTTDVSTEVIKQDDIGLTIRNDVLVADSKQVAAHFKKRHDNVLQAIDNLECSDEFRRLNFQETFQTVAMPNGATRQDTSFTITRDGFSFLAMGFTGREAAVWKEKYINAFNAMEKENRRLQAENQALLEQQTKTLLLENKTLADENYDVKDRNEYLEDKKAMWKDERIQGILRDEVEAQIGIRHELEEKVFSDNWVTCNGDPMNKAEAKSRKKFVKQRFSQVNQGLKGLERVFKGTEQSRNAAILMYINIIRQEIEFARHW